MDDDVVAVGVLVGQVGRHRQLLDAVLVAVLLGPLVQTVLLPDVPGDGAVVAEAGDHLPQVAAAVGSGIAAVQ